MKEYLRKLQEMEEMVQFGAGVTFAELMAQFDDIGARLNEIWPWVPFDPSGDIKCTVIPVPESAGYELILVHAVNAARFPSDEGLKFSISGVNQQVTGISGTLIIEKQYYNDIVTPGVTKKIKAGEPCALRYGHGMYLFKQSPAIGKAEAFSFIKDE